MKGASELISYITLSKWGMKGVCSVANTASGVMQGNWLSGTEVYDATAGSLLSSWGLLLAFSLLYVVLAMVFLSFVDRDER